MNPFAAIRRHRSISQINRAASPQDAQVAVTRYLLDRMVLRRSPEKNAHIVQRAFDRIQPKISAGYLAAVTDACKGLTETLPARQKVLQERSQALRTQHIKLGIAMLGVSALLAVGMGLAFGLGIPTFGLAAVPVTMAVTLALQTFAVAALGSACALNIGSLVAMRGARKRLAYEINGLPVPQRKPVASANPAIFAGGLVQANLFAGL